MHNKYMEEMNKKNERKKGNRPPRFKQLKVRVLLPHHPIKCCMEKKKAHLKRGLDTYDKRVIKNKTERTRHKNGNKITILQTKAKYNYN